MPEGAVPDSCGAVVSRTKAFESFAQRRRGVMNHGPSHGDPSSSDFTALRAVPKLRSTTGRPLLCHDNPGRRSISWSSSDSHRTTGMMYASCKQNNIGRSTFKNKRRRAGAVPKEMPSCRRDGSTSFQRSIRQSVDRISNTVTISARSVFA